MEHLANFLRTTLQEEEDWAENLQELQEGDSDNEDLYYQEFETCILTDESSSEEDPVDK